MGKTKGIGLAELLAQVRNEIDTAQKNLADSGKPGALNWESAEIEISFGVKKDVDGKIGFDIYVFDIEAGAKYKSEEVHKLKLRLTPAAGSPVAIARSPKKKADSGKGV